MLKEKTLNSEHVFRGKILNVRVDTVLLPDGRTGTREVVEYTGAVAVLALTEDQEVIMVRQYRHPVGRELTELPAGKIEEGEDPESSARRELLEEVGCEAQSWRLLGRFYSTPGFTSEEMHLYLAQKLTFRDQAPDEDEFVEVVRVPFAEAVHMALKGQICDAKSICGLLWCSKVLEQRV
ncbi:MAG: NUDIX hydrolase [Ammonifex sp.]|jgi:ADP-ribose pyrophosphatase|nr:MAG: NUDIX hydrolase [Ammonifex sp.]